MLEDRLLGILLVRREPLTASDLHERLEADPAVESTPTKAAITSACTKLTNQGALRKRRIDGHVAYLALANARRFRATSESLVYQALARYRKDLSATIRRVKGLGDDDKCEVTVGGEFIDGTGSEVLAMLNERKAQADAEFTGVR